MLCDPTLYDVDIVFCLDMTCSNQGIVRVREGLSDFYKSLCDRFENEGTGIDKFRVRFVLFKDYNCDPDPMTESRFFTLPDEMEDALAFANGFMTGGGGDRPESSLEALSLAIGSDWNTEKRHRRQVIVLTTDSIPHPLGLPEGARPVNYPENMPNSLDELRQRWDTLDRCKRMYLFAPLTDAWDTFCDWDRVFLRDVEEGANLSGVDLLNELCMLFN